MADLQRAHSGHLFEPFSKAIRAKAPRRQPAAQVVRPRIGQGPREMVRRGKHKIDSGVMLRALAVSGTVAVAVLGGFYALQSMGYSHSDTAVAALEPSSAVSAQVPTVAQVDAEAAVAAELPASAPAQAHLAASVLGEPDASAPAPRVAAPATSKASAAVTRAAAPVRPATPALSLMQSDSLAFASANSNPRQGALGAIADSVGATPAADDPDGGPVPLPAARPAIGGNGDVTGSIGANGRITSAINLRDAPRRGAQVLGTLPAGTKVTVFSCRAWCEVAANGKRGYVYARAVDQ